jgi:glucose/arabinose dehydrogenase
MRAGRRIPSWPCALFVAVVASLAVGCGSGNDDAEGSATVGPIEGSALLRTSVVAEGFDGPTQIADGPEGVLLVAQLAGAERSSTGEVVTLDVASGERTVLLDGLDKPTGVLWREGELWVMERRALTRVAWTGPGAEVGDKEVVLGDLPFNGRSEGALTSLPDGRFLYETSGTLDGDRPQERSGTLWVFDPTTTTSTPVARGAKNAYAHAVLDDGRIVTTEIGDNVTDAPVEELNVVTLTDAPVDLGWPDCRGDRNCDGVVRPLTLLPVASTPTGVAVVGDDLYVALFVTGEVVSVQLAGWEPGDEPVPATTVLEGLEGPHTLLARDDGVLWLSEHLTGRILELRPA